MARRTAIQKIKRMGMFIIAIIATFVLICVGILYVQGSKQPDAGAQYVALGSSFAAGLGLGPSAPGSPIVCQRSVNGYPQQLARLTGLTLTDMSCSGATTGHVLRGGQMFLGPQIDALGPATQLVTLTVGGNDVSYVGDLTAMAYSRRGGVSGFLAGLFWKGAKPLKVRKFDQLQSDLLQTLREVRIRAPSARIFMVTYPAILPPTGNCPSLGVDENEAALMKQVGARLAETTGEAARLAEVGLIDMDRHSLGHDACTPVPWVNGAAPAQGAPFHPSLAGARAVASQIKRALDNTSPAVPRD